MAAKKWFQSRPDYGLSNTRARDLSILRKAAGVGIGIPSNDLIVSRSLSPLTIASPCPATAASRTVLSLGSSQAPMWRAGSTGSPRRRMSERTVATASVVTGSTLSVRSVSAI